MNRTYTRIAAGDYQAQDGTRIYRIPGVTPAAWNAYRVDADGNDVDLVDGAATLDDAKALVDAADPDPDEAGGPLILVTTGHPTLHQHPGPDGEAVHPKLGRLVQPRHLSSIHLTAEAGIPWAADNDCFQGLDEVKFVNMIDKLAGLPGCLFVTVPDVVGDAAATLASFDKWAGALEIRGLPLGLVAQDGMTVDELEDRAHRLAALFIGGSTEWKEGPEAAELARAAKRLGLWVHWGRVNTRRRFDLIVDTGAADSFDGSKWARWRKTYLNIGLSWCSELRLDTAPATV